MMVIIHCCLQAEVEARQVGTALLARHTKEAAAAERRVREQYEAKLRDKQKQLNAVQDRLQVSESNASPREMGFI